MGLGVWSRRGEGEEGEDGWVFRERNGGCLGRVRRETDRRQILPGEDEVFRERFDRVCHNLTRFRGFRGFRFSRLMSA